VERALSLVLVRRGRTRRVVTTALALMTIGAATASSQRPGDRARGRVEEQSDGDTQGRYVTIGFTVGPSSCADRTRTYNVTMRIYNVLAQAVGIPTLAAVSPAGGPVPGSGRPLNGLPLPCGQYIAVWNGRHPATGQRMAPGVYVYDLVIDGQRITRKVTLR